MEILQRKRNPVRKMRPDNEAWARWTKTELGSRPWCGLLQERHLRLRPNCRPEDLHTKNSGTGKSLQLQHEGFGLTETVGAAFALAQGRTNCRYRDRPAAKATNNGGGAPARAKTDPGACAPVRTTRKQSESVDRGRENPSTAFLRMTERNREKSLGPAGALALLAKTEKTKQASKVLSRESSEIDWELRSEESRTKSHEQLTPEAHMNFSMENPPFFV
jgi:hypothetical protein